VLIPQRLEGRYKQARLKISAYLQRLKQGEPSQGDGGELFVEY
jgi:hypothetical protein